MKRRITPRVLAAVLVMFAGALFLSQVSIAEKHPKPKDERSSGRKANHVDAEWLFSSARTTREPWKSFDPLETPTTGESEEEGEGEGEFEGHVDERLEWFLKQRTYPFETLPEGARQRAWDARTEGSNRTAGGQPLAWRAIGPRPTHSDFPNNWGLTSGRINAIAVSPADSNLLLVGAATGGVWRSTNGGTSFTPVTDSQVDLAVGSIVFAPSNPQIVYAGMGDAAGGYLGSGLLRSTDAGATWTRVSNPTLPSPGTIARIAVDPTDANRVYVAQFAAQSGTSLFSSGFFVSNDGGVSFTKTLTGLTRDIVQHPTDPNILYMGVARFDGGGTSTGGVWKSTNKGQTWTRVYTVPFANAANVKVAVTPALPENVYVVSASGTTAALEVSTDGGGIWAARGAAIDTGQFSYNCYLFVHPTNPNTIYIGTRDLWRTTDGGTNYTNITNNFSVAGSYNPTVARSHPDQHHFYILPTNPNTYYVANDGGLSRTTDGGATFASLNNTLGLTMFTSAAVHPSAALRMYGGTQDNGNQRRQPAGTGWEEFQSGDGGQILLDVVDPSILYVTYVRHTIWRYTNHGSNFAATIGSTTSFNSDRIAFYPPFVGNDTNSNIYFGTYRLFVSTNRGTSWAAPGGTFDQTNGGSAVLSAIAVSKSDNNTIYTGASDGRVMVSTNGGGNWTDRTAGLPTRFVKSITVDPANPNTVYVTFSGFLSGHVYRSVNGGQNWTNISGNLPDIPVNTLLMDPRPGNPNTLYAGTDIGVFRTVDGGGTWETFNAGMPPVIVTELVGQRNGLVIASTYGRGAYEINLNGSAPALFDYEADRKADLSIFRPSNNTWYVLGATGFKVLTWGETGDKLAPADYDGDGETDLAVFRPSNGVWYMYLSGTETFTTFGWGQAGDLPVPSDRDGDGLTDLVVYRESNNTWYSRSIVSGPLSSTVFGNPGDKPVRGDFDGDGRGDNAVFRPSNSTWYIQKSSVGFFVQTWGQTGDVPTPADFDGDGSTDLAIFRPSTGQWYRNRSTAGFDVVNWGQNGDIAIAADYDGDGRADPAVFRPGNATWYMNQSSAGFLALAFGQSGDVPTPSAFLY